jgi:hypothetical protein
MEVIEQSTEYRKVVTNYTIKLDGGVLLHCTKWEVENNNVGRFSEDESDWDWDSDEDVEIFNKLPEEEQEDITEFIEELPVD